MHHNSATKPLQKVPGHTCLYRRGARYYFRLGVPENLRPIVGRRELVKSLQTTDYALAKERVTVEERKGRDILRAARSRTENGEASKAAAKPPQPLTVTSDSEAQELAKQWFLKIEKDGAKWWLENRQRLSPTDRAELRAEFWTQREAITGEADTLHPNQYDDGKWEVRAFLRLHNFTLDERSEDFALLAQWFREARLEHVRRCEDRIEGRPVRHYETLFRDLTEHTPILPVRKGATIEQLTKQFLHEYEKAGKAPKTISQYGVTASLLAEIFGGNRTAASITRDDVVRFCDLLETMPEHRANRYSTARLRIKMQARNCWPLVTASLTPETDCDGARWARKQQRQSPSPMLGGGRSKGSRSFSRFLRREFSPKCMFLVAPSPSTGAILQGFTDCASEIIGSAIETLCCEGSFNSAPHRRSIHFQYGIYRTPLAWIATIEKLFTNGHLF